MARQTICFSRSVEIHEKVIGAFIEKHMFYSLESLPPLLHPSSCRLALSRSHAGLQTGFLAGGDFAGVNIYIFNPNRMTMNRVMLFLTFFRDVLRILLTKGNYRRQ
ncbi:hypothetical protein CE195_02045 [Sodalis-like symbiont of Philaenus spumarius]|nr:hypothetical protein CE195_02045 [Sodalis-like symbiont of Philaenus spumarius]